MPAAGAAGSPKATLSPTCAPVTVIVRVLDAAAAMDGKSSVAVAEIRRSIGVPVPTRNPSEAVAVPVAGSSSSTSRGAVSPSSDN